MALTGIGADFYLPMMRGNQQALDFTSYLMNASGEKMAHIIQIQKGGTIDTVGFRTGTVTTAGTLRVSLQDVSLTTGDPDGTMDQFRDVTSPASDTYYETGLITSDGTDIGTKRTVSQGDLLAVVIDFASFTTESLNIVGDTEFRVNRNFPYFDRNQGSWAPQDIGLIGHIKYADGSYEQQDALMPIASYTQTSFNSASTPDEYALKINLPFDCRIRGFWIYCDLDNDADVVLYDAASSAEATLAIDPQVQQNATNGRPSVYYFATAVEYTKSTIKRLALKPGASSSQIFYFTCNSGLLAGAPMGTNMVLSTRTDAGSWTDDTDSRPLMGLIIDQVHDDDAGGGGGGGATQVVGGPLVS